MLLLTTTSPLVVFGAVLVLGDTSVVDVLLLLLAGFSTFSFSVNFADELSGASFDCLSNKKKKSKFGPNYNTNRSYIFLITVIARVRFEFIRCTGTADRLIFFSVTFNLTTSTAATATRRWTISSSGTACFFVATKSVATTT